MKGKCSTTGCDDLVGVKYLGLCHACARWLQFWNKRTASAVLKRVQQIRRLNVRVEEMPLPGVRGKGKKLQGKLLQFRRKAS